MRTPDRDPNLRLTRRRFVQGIAAVSVAAMVEGKSSLACSEMISNSPAVLAGNHFDLTIKPHPVNFTGKEVKAIAINGSISGPTLKWREGETVTVAVTNRLPVEHRIHIHRRIRSDRRIQT
jgi:FtsP/CotA-like multicopper oxidase with cupredoxin domain